MNNAELLNLSAGELRAMYANAMDQLEAVKRLLDEEPKPVTISAGGCAVGKTTELLHELLRDNLAHQVRMDEMRKAMGMVTNDSQLDHDVYEFPLPHWAIGYSRGEYVIGSHLQTRDGRRTGNAHIIEVSLNPELGDLYRCLTDAGNEMTLTEQSLRDQFYPPCWVADVDEVKRKFGTSRPNLEVASD